MSILLILLFGLIIIQNLSGVVQVKYYQRFIKKITTQYSSHTDYKLYTDVSNNFFAKTIVAVVIDNQGRIMNCYIYRGLTVFAQFKEAPLYQGVDLSAIHQKREESTRISKAEEVLHKIYLRDLEAIA